jgi:hypothetical protein
MTEKEINKTSDRWIRIKKNDIEVTISSPHEEDKLKDLVEKANEIVRENSFIKSSPIYTN